MCATIVYRDEGRSLIVVDDAHRNMTIAWGELACLDGRAVVTDSAQPIAAESATSQFTSTGPVTSTATVADEIVSTDEPGERKVWFEWDVRLAGTTFFKRYVERNTSAWSWGLGAGLGFGAAVHYALGAAKGGGPIRWSDLELGIAGTVTYGTWHQINAGEASVIEQDVSLRVGARFQLGPTHSGMVVGISWLPTYVDFYGRLVKTAGAINPLGMRLTFDLGSALGTVRRAPVFRIALSYLPYVGKAPSMFGLSAGIAID